MEQAEAKALYYPRAYDSADIEAFIKSGGQQLDYKTIQGNQAAWLINTIDRKPQRLWMVCGGNGTLALELVPFIREANLKTDAFVVIDYPGYGVCEGKPNPRSVRENVRAAVLAACEATGIDPAKHPEQISVLGHSLGCSVALMAVEEFHLKSAVLCSPFTSTHEMAELRNKLPKDAPFAHQYDNRPGLKELQSNKGHAWIFHGSDDEIIPVRMSQTLAGEFKETVTLTVVNDAHHNDLLLIANAGIYKTMANVGK